MAFTVVTSVYESFDAVVYAGQGTGRWDNTSTISQTTYGRRGSSSGRMYQGSLSKTLPSACQDFAYNFTLYREATLGWTAGIQVALVDNGTLQAELRNDASGRLILTRNATALGTATGSLSLTATHTIEWLCHIDDAPNGWSNLWVDGSAVLSLTGIDTKTTANASATRFWLGDASLYSHYDDFYVRCGSGMGSADALVDVGVACLRPTSDVAGGSLWTPSTGSLHYAVTDDTTQSLTDTDYDSGSAVGAQQANEYGNLASTGYTVLGAQYNVWLKKDDVGTRNVKIYCVSGTATSWSPAYSVLDTWTNFTYQWETDPNTGSAWTATALNAAQFGYRLDF